MYTSELKRLEKISAAVGSHADLVQGGGGNTSVKINDGLMAVKASGFSLKDVTCARGYVVVKYKDIIDYYEKVDLNSPADYESESTAFTKGSVIAFNGTEKYRPSVEAGFHSILKKYVIHTHAVYANILCCSKEGKRRAEEIFKEAGLSYLWIPYVDPGFSLTFTIKKEIDMLLSEGAAFPQVIFMQNHGLIVNDDDPDECLSLHTRVNTLIKQCLGLHDFPKIELNKLEDEKYESVTSYITDYLKKDVNGDKGFFGRYVIYPDQLVYLNGSLGTKIELVFEKNKVIYNAGFKEALAFEETMAAYFYVIDEVERCRLTLTTMSDEQIAFINGWESEKYRKNLLKGR